MEDLTGQTSATAIDPTEWNAGMYQEFKNFIEIWQTMTQADAAQLNKGLNNAISTFNFYSASGPANTYALALIGTKPGPSLLIDGMEIRFRPNVANTGATTVNLNSLGAKDVRREDGTTILQANDFVTGRDVHLRYNGTLWLLHVPYMGSNPMTVLPKQYRFGLTMGRNPGDANKNQDVRLAIGGCRSQADDADMILSSILDKRWDAAFAVGTAAGGYPSSLGTRLANTWYRFFFITNTVSGEVDAGWDASADAAATALIAAANTAHGTGGVGEWVYRQRGWTKTTGTITEFVPFKNEPSDPDLFMFAGGENVGRDVDSLAIGSGAFSSTQTLSAPPSTIALCGVYIRNDTGSLAPETFGWLTSTDSDLATPSATSGNFWAFTAATERRPFGGSIEVAVNATSQALIKTQSSVSGNEVSIWTRGFRFRTT